MSHQTETGGGESLTRAELSPPLTLEVIACDGCGRWFATDDGPGMMALIKGACPDCGGRFLLTATPAEDRLL